MYRRYLEDSPLVAQGIFLDEVNANAAGYQTLAQAQLSSRHT